MYIYIYIYIYYVYIIFVYIGGKKIYKQKKQFGLLLIINPLMVLSCKSSAQVLELPLGFWWIDNSLKSTFSVFLTAHTNRSMWRGWYKCFLDLAIYICIYIMYIYIYIYIYMHIVCISL